MNMQVIKDFFQNQCVPLEQSKSPAPQPKMISAPLLAALKSAGTSHIYADTADSKELRDVIEVEQNTIIAEVDGNTVNQPLVAKVLYRHLDKDKPANWAQELLRQRPVPIGDNMIPWLYSLVCGQIGNDIVQAFANDRSWQLSLQLHMSVVKAPELAKQIGRALRVIVPGALIKVPFSPYAPACFLIARDLENEKIPVNFTATFSARQVVAAALLADVSKTNIFMGRLDQGLEAERLGAHVDLEAQRQLLGLRGNLQTKTELIVASLRNWESMVQTAGCDVYTVPCSVLQKFLHQQEVPAEHIQNQLATSYEDRLGISDKIISEIGSARIARLYRVESEFVEFLLEYRKTTEYQQLKEGDQLVRRFEEAGFKDFFYAPNHSEWTEIRRTKIPALDARVTKTVSIDTLYSLLADADFEKHQDDMDREIEEIIQG